MHAERPPTPTERAGEAEMSKQTTRTFKALLTTIVVALQLAVLAPIATAEFDVTGFDGTATSADGTSLTQAGAHADVSTSFSFATRTVGSDRVPDGSVRDIDVTLPAGLVGDPTAAPTCTDAELVAGPDGIVPACPLDAQVGSAFVDVGYLSEPYLVGVYNMKPTDGVPARFAFNVVGVLVYVDADLVNDGDYHLVARVRNVSQGVPILGTSLTLWGVPSDPVHDADRYDPSAIAFGARSSLPRRAFMTLPTDCAAGPLTTTLRARSWQQPDMWRTASFVSHDDAAPTNPTGVTGCERLRFDPSLQIRPTTTLPDAPTGLNVALTLPQSTSPDGLATANLKDVVVTLPDGMTINPSGADGLEGCTDAQLGLGTDAPIACPERSKIGDAEAVTPLLAEKLTGGVYIRSQNSSDPASGEMYRIALVLENARRGISVRLAGQLRVNDRGRIETTFNGNPQLPVSELDLSFKSGGRAPLATPPACGPQTATATLTSWAGQTAHVTDGFTFECVGGGFAPSFVAGTGNPVAGAFTSFGVRFGREDREQQLGGIDIDAPPGLTARIADVPVLCADAAAAVGACMEGSRIGSVTSAAGAGDPFTLPGRVDITGPYKGAPFGLSIVVPAVAGPFDLGTVVVRAAIYVDRNDASLRIASDPLPTILKGVPLRIRMVDVDVDRPSFVINPTNCARQRIDGVISSVAGTKANVSTRFQAGSCASLPFAPKMTIKVGARGRTGRGVRTPLEATLAMTRGQANNRSVQLTLPKTLNARLDVVSRRRACSIEQFQTDRCPTVVGTATATTPLLRDPLRGPAYFVFNPARRLPDLVVRLKGQVDIDLVGKVTITRDLKLQTTFDTVPDVPVTRFALRLVSGKNGPIGAVRNLCDSTTRRQSVAAGVFAGQNGTIVRRDLKISVAGCARSAKRHASGRRPARAKRRGAPARRPRR
jgi:hypothetical protein